MDVTELRRAFTGAARMGDEIRRFREERVLALKAGDYVMDMPVGPKIVLHVLPFSGFAIGKVIDVRMAERFPLFLRPPKSQTTSKRYNIDGILAYDARSGNTTNSYIQLYRDARVECVESSIIRQDKALIPSLSVEAALIASLARIFRLYTELGVEPPAAVMITLTGVKSFRIGLDAIDEMSVVQSQVDRAHLLVPPVIAETYVGDAAVVLRPAFDVIWNAAGISQCLDYDGAGGPLPRLRSLVASGMY